MKLIFENGLYIENWFVDNVSLDGGGTTQYLDFLNYFKNQKKCYNRALEWCSGLGAIGFSLLDAKVTNHITFMDIYEPAITFIGDMAKLNNIENKVNTYCKGRIQDLPSYEKFDLIVGNPPHLLRTISFQEAHEQDLKRGVPPRQKWHLDESNRLLADVDWKIHKEFFNNIGKYCNPGCDIFISEVGGQEIYNLALAPISNLKFKQNIPAPCLADDSNQHACIQWFTYQPGSI